MAILNLANIGELAGCVTALLLHLLFCLVRRYIPALGAIVGWLVSVLWTAAICLLYFTWTQQRNDPSASCPGAWLIIALMLSAALSLCALLGAMQARLLQIFWLKGIGIMAAEAATAILCGAIANEFLYDIAEVMRGGSRDIPQILASSDQARNLLSEYYGGLMMFLILAEVVGPFIYKWKSRSNTVHTTT